MSSLPRVSVGIPVYCGENYLAQLLDSITGQTFRDIEIVICDNASTDRTQEICQEYARRDDRIRYFRNEENIGAVRNYNRVFELARADYFKWTAHDDLYDPTYLERCVEVLDRSPDVVLAHAETRMINGAGEPILFDEKKKRYVDDSLGETLRSEPTNIGGSTRPQDRFHDILFRAYWCTAIFGVIRSSALRTTSLHKSYYGSDKVLLSELALIGRFHHIEEPLFGKRQHLQTSHFKGSRERAKWIDPSVRTASAILPLFKGYLNAATHYGDLSLGQRASCAASILHKAGFALIRRTGETFTEPKRAAASPETQSSAP